MPQAFAVATMIVRTVEEKDWRWKFPVPSSSGYRALLRSPRVVR